ncbi:MAG: thioesterase family protein [Alphaproteobacteria bacterium]|nr:thioesterase family protein [Alphaproteobacteria bacterium]
MILGGDAQGDLAEPVFRLEGDTAHPTRFAAGPWDPGLQHGGAPASLLAMIIDGLPAERPMQVSRLTLDLMRPVPIAPLRIETEVTREGRNIQTVDAVLSAGGKEVVRAHALRIRTADDPVPEDRRFDRSDLPDIPPAAAVHNLPFKVPGFSEALDLRPLRDQKPGFGAAWFHHLRPFVEGHETTPLMRMAAAADYCNGISRSLDFNEWTFINADLTIHITRAPRGEWILLEGQTWLSDEGRGLAHGMLCDRHGIIGRTTQCLVLARR